MADNMQKIKLLRLYEFLRRETDEDHPISRMKLCQQLNDMGISSNVRTLSLDIAVLRDNGFEIISYLKDKEKFYYIPEQDLTQQVFKMFGGELQEVVLHFDKSLIGPVFDKFGEDTPMTVVDADTISATVQVQVSPTFFGWLAQFGNQMQIVSPKGVEKQFQKHITEMFLE